MLCCKNVTGELICTSCLHLPGYGEKWDLWHCPLCHQRDSPVLIPNASGQRWAAFFSFLPQPLQLGMATSLLGGLGDKTCVATAGCPLAQGMQGNLVR